MRPYHLPLLDCQHLERGHYLGGCASGKAHPLPGMEVLLHHPSPFRSGFSSLIQGRAVLKKPMLHHFDHENGLDVLHERNRHRAEADETRMTSLCPGHRAAHVNPVVADHHLFHFLSEIRVSPNATIWRDLLVRLHHGGIHVLRVICKTPARDNRPVYLSFDGQTGGQKEGWVDGGSE